MIEAGRQALSSSSRARLRTTSADRHAKPRAAWGRLPHAVRRAITVEVRPATEVLGATRYLLFSAKPEQEAPAIDPHRSEDCSPPKEPASNDSARKRDQDHDRYIPEGNEQRRVVGAVDGIECCRQSAGQKPRGG